MIENMAVLAVVVCFLQPVVTGFLVRLLLMLMRMVTKMQRRTTLVLTVDRSSGPGVLGRQQEHQNDKDEFFHDADNTMIRRIRQTQTSLQVGEQTGRAIGPVSRASADAAR